MKGGERPTTRPARHRPKRRTRPGQPRPAAGTASDQRPADGSELDAFVKKVVDALPPLTEEQRDLLALIFRGNHHQ